MGGGLRKRTTRRVSRRSSFRKPVRKSARKPHAARRSKGRRKVSRRTRRHRRVKRRMVGGMDLVVHHGRVWSCNSCGLVFDDRDELLAHRRTSEHRVISQGERFANVLEDTLRIREQLEDDMRSAAEAEEEIRRAREAERAEEERQRAASSGEFPDVTTTNPGLRWMVEYELRTTPYEDENTLPYPKLRGGEGAEIRKWICRFEGDKLIVKKLGMGNQDITYDIGDMDAQEDYAPPQIHVRYIAGEGEECFGQECRLILKFKNKTQLRAFMAGFV